MLQIVLGLNIAKLFFILSSTTIPIFIIFEPRLLPQLDEKRCKGEKCM